FPLYRCPRLASSPREVGLRVWSPREQTFPRVWEFPYVSNFPCLWESPRVRNFLQAQPPPRVAKGFLPPAQGAALPMPPRHPIQRHPHTSGKCKGEPLPISPQDAPPSAGGAKGNRAAVFAWRAARW